MTVRVKKTALLRVGTFSDLTVWKYHTKDHILDAMTKPAYFARCADRLRIGDVILVDCPGYYELRSFMGGEKTPIKRPGGGVLQVDAISELNLVAIRVVGRGLRAFVNPTETVIWSEDGAASTDDPSEQKSA